MAVKKIDSIKKEKEKYLKKYGKRIYKKWGEDEINKLADDLLDWFKQKVKNEDGKVSILSNIWMKDFFIDHYISNQQIDNIKKKSDYFFEIYSICQDIQESKLVKLGMSKNVAGAMPIFALKNVCKWRDTEKENIVLTNEYTTALIDKAKELINDKM